MATFKNKPHTGQSVLFGIDQTFAFWTLLLGAVHFQWLHPLPGLFLATLAGWRIYIGSAPSKIFCLAWAVAAVTLHVFKQHELFYFLVGIYLPAALLVHTFFYERFVIDRRSLAALPSFLSVLFLYPGSFYVLHEPGMPIPSLFTASGFISIPFLPFHYLMLTNQDTMIRVLQFLNW